MYLKDVFKDVKLERKEKVSFETLSCFMTKSFPSKSIINSFSKKQNKYV
jgi:hypothetical protein